MNSEHDVFRHRCIRQLPTFQFVSTFCEDPVRPYDLIELTFAHCTMPSDAESRIIQDVNNPALSFPEVLAGFASTEWVTYMGNLNIDARKRFAFCFTSEDKLDDLFAGASAPQNPSWSLKADFRVLWLACRAACKSDFTKLEKESESSALASADDPITELDRESLLNSFSTKYSFHLKPVDTPNDTTLGRMFRDAKSKNAKYIDLTKVKSIMQQQKSENVTKPKIGDMEIRMYGTGGEDQPTPIATDHVFLHKIEVLMNGLSLAGNRAVSQTNPELWHSYQTSHDYVSLFRQSLPIMGRDRCLFADRQIRERVMDLVVNHSLSSSVAYEQAIKENKFLLLPTSSFSPSTTSHPDLPAYGPWPTHDKGKGKGNPYASNKGKGKGKGGKGKGGKAKGKGKDRGMATALVNDKNERLCKRWNDTRGCPGGCGYVHQCDVLGTGGRACQANHRRIEHK